MTAQKAELQVENIACTGCAQTITDALNQTQGVTDAQVDVAAKQVTVSYDDEQTSEAQIRQAIGDAGYTVAE